MSRLRLYQPTEQQKRLHESTAVLHSCARRTPDVKRYRRLLADLAVPFRYDPHFAPKQEPRE